MDQIVTPQVMLRIGHEDRESASGGWHEHRHPVSGHVQARVPLAG